MRLFEDNQPWVRVSPTNQVALELFKRHYSCKKNRGEAPRFVGPGEEITLLTKDNRSLFVWRKEKFRMDKQEGVNCAVFRNENMKVKASSLILEAEQIAWRRWPGARLFTFVDPKKVKTRIPGYCFKKAGWNECGLTKKKGLIIFEKVK